MDVLPNTLALLTALLLQFLQLPPPQRENPALAVSIKNAAAENHQQAAALLAEDERYWSAPFVLADLEKREVTVWGQMAAMMPGDPLEFFVIGEESGHDYEALMTTFAQPSDIHRAMEFIGGKAGGSVDSTVHRFWPRGDRFAAELELKLPGKDAPERIAIEQFVTRADGSVMQAMPWVFTGSAQVPSPEDESKRVYGADLHSPNSVASAFNLSATVFDLPLQGSKSQVYGQYLRNRALPVPEATPVLLRLRPAAKDRVPRDVDLVLRFQKDDVLQVEEQAEPRETTLAKLADELKTRENENHFLHLDFGAELPLARLITLAREIQVLEQSLPSVRLEPPPAGQLFFQAFVPDPRYRKRTERPTQPLELHLHQTEGQAVRATLMQLEEVWGDSRTPDILETRIPLETPAAWMEWLGIHKPRIPVVFVYAPATLRHGDLLRWLSPVLERFPVVFVYTEE